MKTWPARHAGKRLTLMKIAVAWLLLSCVACRSAEHVQTSPIHIVIAIAEPEYGTEKTLPALAGKRWTKEHGYKVSVITGDPEKHDMPGLVEVLPKADVLVLSIRRQALPEAQLQAIRDHLDAGRPLLAIRTSSHAFALRENSREQPPNLDGRAQWPEFDAQVLGGNYHGHYPHDQTSTVHAASEDARQHPILAGITMPFVSTAAVYKNNPLAPSAQPLLIAQPADHPPEPVAWTHTFGTARVFYTSLGSVDDFDQPGFAHLLEQAMLWLCDPE